MGFFLANPWGLLFLGGLPAVLLIHLLRRQSRRVVVSTLFLVDQALPSNEGGRRIRRLRNSLPLWLQFLAVLALTWLAVQPRWIARDSTQTVVAVLDTSASMSAFRDAVAKDASADLESRARTAARTRWIFLASNGVQLASGWDLAETWPKALAAWQPVLGVHDLREVFRLARTLAGSEGAIVFYTDHPPAADESFQGAQWIASGRPIDNAGFLGARAEGDRWIALLRNYSPQKREIRWRVAGQPDWQKITLDGSATTELSGAFPSDRVLLETEADAFPLDDPLPIIRPQAKPLAIQVPANEGYAEIFRQILRLAAPFNPAGSGAEADLTFGLYTPLAPRQWNGPALIFVDDSGSPPKLLGGLIVAENDPLMEHLNWQGLLVRDTFGVPFRQGDQALLWQGGRPLIFLRQSAGAPQLVFNFDLRTSNILRLPAFPLLTHRFISQVRAAKPAYAAENVETRQPLRIAGHGPFTAPAQPDFFSVQATDGSALFDGAAQFADWREADFHAADSGRSEDAALAAVRQAHERGQFLDPLWAFLLSALLLANWFATGRPARIPSQA